MARTLSGRIVGARQVGEKIGQSVIVENRPGAGSNLATADVAHAPPDGYMLMLLTTANVINAALYQNLSYDLLRDICRWPASIMSRLSSK